jgi:predicted XRE-type DNA-binding protein
MARTGKIRQTSNWIAQTKYELEHEEEILARTAIILQLLSYMKEHQLNQKELAALLGVSAQYVNKLLHGQDFDLKISTALRYSRILGIPLIIVPGVNDNISSINYCPVQ